MWMKKIMIEVLIARTVAGDSFSIFVPVCIYMPLLMPTLYLFILNFSLVPHICVHILMLCGVPLTSLGCFIFMHVVFTEF